MLLHYPKPYIQDATLATLLGGSKDRRYSWVKRALKKGELTRLKKGTYLIEKNKAGPVDAFEIAQHLYGPSYISFESALAFHGWIPEAVYTTTSACAKRATTFKTPIGAFSYTHTPQRLFFMGVERLSIASDTFLIAHPWKALADYVYVYRKNWNTLEEILEDLRIEKPIVETADHLILKEISEYYGSTRVRNFARKILGDLNL